MRYIKSIILLIVLVTTSPLQNFAKAIKTTDNLILKESDEVTERLSIYGWSDNDFKELAYFEGNNLIIKESSFIDNISSNATISKIDSDVKIKSNAGKDFSDKVDIVTEEDGSCWFKVRLAEGDWMDDIFDIQKSVVNQNKNIIANASNNAKGAWGEMSSDVFLTSKGYQPLHPRKTALTQGWGETGIDGIFVKDGQYYIVEAKYSGTSQLKMTNDGKQMSDTWIRARNYERVRNAINDNNIANELINMGYQRILAKTAPDGSITYKLLNENGNIIGNFIP